MVRPSHSEWSEPVPRRGTIMVSPTQAVPEVPVVWGYDDIRGIVCRRYTIMVAKIPPKITQKTNATKSHQNSATKITSKKRDGNDPTIIAYLRHAARATRHLTAPRPSTHNPQKKMSNKPEDLIAHFLSPLRCGRDSNSRPHA